jgi:hypothetical protein
MPQEEAELNMRLFAERVMPVLQRDPAFEGRSPSAPADSRAGAESILAPA